MLSEFARKRETFFDLKKHNFSKLKKSHVFSKELTHAFGQKMPIFFYLDLVKKRLELMLNYFDERKETSLTIKNRIFQSPKDHIFFKRVNPCFWPKYAIFFLI